MKQICVVLLIATIFSPGSARAADAKKKLLAIGEEKGYRHESVSHALATIERLGRETGLWDTTIRTDTEALTKKKLEYNAKNLNDFDAVLFYMMERASSAFTVRPSRLPGGRNMAR